MTNRIWAFQWNNSGELAWDGFSCSRESIETNWATELRCGWGVVVSFRREDKQYKPRAKNIRPSDTFEESP